MTPLVEAPSPSPASRDTRRLGIVLAMALGAILLVPWFVGPPGGTAAALQNRPPAPFPAVSVSALANIGFYAAIDAAIADRLRAKPAAVAAVNGLVLSVTGRSASPLVVAETRDRGLPEAEQLYYAGEFTEPCPLARDPQLAAAGHDRLRQAAAVGGKDVVYFVAPNKSTTLPLAPGSATHALMACADSARGQLADLAATPGSPVVMLEPDQVLRWDASEPYWPGDSHWTSSGGLSLVSGLVEAFGGTTEGLDQRFSAVESSLTNQAGMYAMLGIEHYDTSPWPRPASGEPVFEDVPGITPYVPTHFVSPDPLPGMPRRVLIIYDSFVYTPRIQAAVASIFAEGWFLQWDAITDVGALPQVDAVIIESVERIAAGRLAGFYVGSPFQALLDYLAASPQPVTHAPGDG